MRKKQRHYGKIDQSDRTICQNECLPLPLQDRVILGKFYGFKVYTKGVTTQVM